MFCFCCCPLLFNTAITTAIITSVNAATSIVSWPAGFPVVVVAAAVSVDAGVLVCIVVVFVA